MSTLLVVGKLNYRAQLSFHDKLHKLLGILVYAMEKTGAPPDDMAKAVALSSGQFEQDLRAAMPWHPAVGFHLLAGLMSEEEEQFCQILRDAEAHLPGTPAENRIHLLKSIMDSLVAEYLREN